MSTAPWDPDRLLTPDLASLAIGACFPAIDLRIVTHIGSGWEFDAYATTEGWVFRFPRREHCAALFEPEARVHRLVGAALPARIAVPRVELMGEATVHFPYSFAGHRFIAGVPTDAADTSLLGEVASDIGVALGAVHGVPESDARAAGVREADADEEPRLEWVASGVRRAEALTGLDPGIDEAVEWARHNADVVPRFDGPRRFVHQDLSPEHLLVDPATGQLTGILDWTDAILGDAARDFVALVTCHGWMFAEQVLASYPHPLDDGFRARLRFMAQLLSVVWLGEAHERRSDVAKHAGWVRNAFAASPNGSS